METDKTGSLDKVLRLGTTPEFGPADTPIAADVFCRVRYRDGRLSITGVIGPRRDGDAWGGCGQIVGTVGAAEISPAPGWDADRIARFLAAWDRWHLNDMRAGTPEQMAALERRRAEFPGYPVSHYDWALDVLKAEGLQPHNGYSYGSAWLREDVPADVLAFLASLPDTDKTPAWV